MSWRTLPDFDNLALENVRWLRSDTAALERRIRSDLGDSAFFSVSTGLPQVLEDADRSLLVSRSGVLLLTIQFVVLAAYALVLVAGLLVDQRRIETAMLRSRGASAGHVAWMALLEGLVLVVPAALAAPWIALGALELFDAIGPLAAAGVTIEPRVDAAALIVAGIAGLACLVGLVVPAFASGRGLAAVRQTVGRQGNRTLAQRLGIDLALVILAGIGLWQLRQYGAPLTATVRGSVGLDPLLVAAPAIGLLAGAILALRIVPLLAELAERLLGTRRGLVAPLGARQLARRPLRYTRSALLLMLAAALGTFAAAYTTTWTRSQADQAAYQAGGDLRVEVAQLPGPAAVGVRSGVRRRRRRRAAMPVVIRLVRRLRRRRAADSSSRSTPRTLTEVADVRPDLLGGHSLAELADAPVARPRRVCADPAPREPRPALVIDLDTSLENFPAEDEDGAAFVGPFPETLARRHAERRGPGRAGLLHVVEARAAPGRGGRAANRGPPDGRAFDRPGRARPTTRSTCSASSCCSSHRPIRGSLGTIEVTSVAIQDAAGASTDIELEPSRDGWSWLIERGLNPAEAAPTAAGSPEVVAFAEEQPIYGDEGPVELRLLPDSLAEVADRPLPIVVSRSFADATLSNVGDSVAIGSLTRRTQVEIAAHRRRLPHARSGAARSRSSTWAAMRSRRTPATGRTCSPTSGGWRSPTSPRPSPTLAEEPYSVETLVSRTELHRAAHRRSRRAGRHRRAGDRLDRRAHRRRHRLRGQRGRQHARAARRVRAVARPGPIAGAAVGLAHHGKRLPAGGRGSGRHRPGLVLSWLVLPFVTLTADARIVVPPVLVEIPWPAIGFVILLAAVALVVTVIVIGGILRRVPVSGVLRAGQD